MYDLFELIIKEKGSDLHLEVGVPPVIRINGKLIQIKGPKLIPDDTFKLIQSFTADEHLKIIKETGTADFGFDYKGKARFRVSAFKQKGYYGAVLRLITKEIMPLEEIGLDDNVIRNLLFKPRGLILLTGPTGSGKSTTLTSMIDIINEERNVHIITIEDPIEFYHDHKKSIITQRELTTDTVSFDDALIRSLRQDPDVIMVGEMRDINTIKAAITAAETGHLVFGTLHTTGTTKTLDRIVDAFPTTQQEEIRIMLSTSLQAIISQILVERQDKPGRVAAFEVMVLTPSIRAIIRENKTHLLTSELQTGAKKGMYTLDNCLVRLYNKGIISYTDLIIKAQDPESVEKTVNKD
ncbi:MAG: PilT/PilU family type 4a pilus ATPase [Victivallales bacterium]|nr:PilT/PilU family type 4a pilus ATPase [Victivallales bacterium]MCF7888504.1 PilT/PilU family type 4a pilus ATPase [Victivallales bacterium]